MNGAEALVRTLVGAGVEVCFTNPGTSEMHFVAALDRVEGMRPILALFEGVASGAADGYGRMIDRPASTLLHLGPGLANGLANLHNASKARTPVVNLVGDHATRHQRYDAPLSADVEAFARPVSSWVRSAGEPRDVPELGAAAVAAALEPPGGVATLIVPADAAWGEGARPAAPQSPGKRGTASPEAVATAAAALRSGEPCALLVGGAGLRGRAPGLARRIADSSGALLFCDTFNTRMERGAGRVAIPPLPYFAEAAGAALDGVRHLIVVGTQAPVSFFAYPGRPDELWPADCARTELAGRADDVESALETLAEELGAPETARTQELVIPDAPRGPLNPGAIGASLAALLPEGAIVSDEAITAAAALFPATLGAAPHDWLGLTGGSIGQGLPVATGAAVACPDRKVVCLEGDGSALYTIQALWTQAREGLDVTTVILANRSYAILQIELQRLGLDAAGQHASDMLSLGRPELDFVALARGLGIPASRASSAEEFHARLAVALAEPGPHLIEAVY